PCPSTARAPTRISPLSLHDALPICGEARVARLGQRAGVDRPPLVIMDRLVARGLVPLLETQIGIADPAKPVDDNGVPQIGPGGVDRKSTRLNSSHVKISYAVFCLKK